jgi:N-methylhydantoinase B
VRLMNSATLLSRKIGPGTELAGAVDPITVEVIRNLFISAAEEMKINLARTAYNPVVFEMYDFAVGLFDPQGNMIAQAPGLPVFLGTLGENVRIVTQDVGGLANFRPGDLYLINDPYAIGSHLADVTSVSPVFFQDELVGFSAAKMHWLDIGGKDPGSWSNTSSVFQEGLRFRSIKLFDGGRPVEPIFQVIRYNVRLSTAAIGDLRAQIAATRTGERRFLYILEKYGKKTVDAAVQQIYQHAEKLARRAVEQIPDGVYEAVGYMDNDGLNLEKENLPMKVKVTVYGSQMEVDLTGSAPENKGPVNCGRAAAISAVRMAFKCVTTPDLPVNEGNFRNLSITIPPRTMFSAEYPAPTCQWALHLITLIDTALKALIRALPHSVPAGHYSDFGVFIIYGYDPRTGRNFIHTDSSSGGWGGRPHEDGESTLICLVDGDSKNIPVEIIEHQYPLRIERFALRDGSGGAGKFRGGLGHFRDYRVLTAGVKVVIGIDRHNYKPWGWFGGDEGESNDVVLNPGPGQRSIRKVADLGVPEGSLISLQSGGGGGYGPPSQRDPALVLSDWLGEYITAQCAREDYAVSIVGDKLDLNQTQLLRQRLSEPTPGEQR